MAKKIQPKVPPAGPAPGKAKPKPVKKKSRGK
jgi:hypothetical protein